MGAQAHHHEESFVSKYVFSHDHKMISKQFLVTAIVMGIVAVMLSVFFRLQLGWPGESFAILETFLGKWAPGGVLDRNAYLALVTIHGTIMVFFVLTGGLSGTFSNLLIPLQIGARDMASGFLEYVELLVLFLLERYHDSLLVCRGWGRFGWLDGISSLECFAPGDAWVGHGHDFVVDFHGPFCREFAAWGLNYVVTIINLRTKGMSMTRLPLTIWAFMVTAILGVLSFPVLVSAVVLLLMDRTMGTAFYLSDIFIGGEALDVTVEAPILYQHLFWFLGHPEVYIVLLPALGISSEVIATNARKPIFGYKAMVGSLLGIGFLSFIVWGHHMFVTGMNPFLGSVFVFTTLLIAIPSAVKAFNYITTLWQGNIRFTPAMLFSIGLVSTFVTGGLTGSFWRIRRWTSMFTTPTSS